jgi:hypothetical protein
MSKLIPLRNQPGNRPNEARTDEVFTHLSFSPDYYGRTSNIVRVFFVEIKRTYKRVATDFQKPWADATGNISATDKLDAVSLVIVRRARLLANLTPKPLLYPVAGARTV